MKVNNFGFGSQAKFHDIWPWIVAFDAFDFGDPEPLDALLSDKAQPIPEEARQPLADIVSGRRKPNLKAAAKLKIPAAERMKVAATISAVLGLNDVFKFEEIGDDRDDFRFAKAVQINAAKQRIEPIDEIRSLDSYRAEAISIAVEEFGVSTETVENLVRVLRKKIDDFPKI